MTSSPTSASRIDSKIAEARAAADGIEYVPVSDCVDWLLDCLNAAERENVRTVITEILPDFTHGNLRRTETFVRALDQVELAVQITAVAAEFDLDADPVG